MLLNVQRLELDVEGFLHIMTFATLHDMPKLLACCECYIAQSSFQCTAGSQTRSAKLRAQCMSEPQLGRSWSHIAEGFCMAFERLYMSSRRQPCNCACCQGCKEQGGDSCKCFLPATQKELNAEQRSIWSQGVPHNS